MGFQVRHSSAFDEMIRRVHNGDIGRIVAAQLYYNAGGGGGAKPAVEDDEFRIRHHFQYLELSGGTLNDQAVHMMDICREVLQANPLYAMGHSSRKGVKCEYGNFNTNYQILYKYPEDINVMVQQTSVGAATGGVVARFFGENGTAEAKYSGGVFITGPNKWDSGIDNALGDADTNKGRSFIGSIISGNYINEIEAGCNSTLMAILGREAAAKGKTLTWNKLVKSNQRYGNQPDLSKF
jgi:predicted dehydrogenase